MMLHNKKKYDGTFLRKPADKHAFWKNCGSFGRAIGSGMLRVLRINFLMKSPRTLAI
jgi:hypothetical protein